MQNLLVVSALITKKKHIRCRELRKQALDLIKRQKAENEELWEERNRIYENLKETKTELEEYRTAYVNAQAEIDRLQKTVVDLNANITDLIFQKEKDKSEVIKEFAERLKENTYFLKDDEGFECAVVFVSDIDNLLEEMESERE